MNTFFDIFEYETVESSNSEGVHYRIFHNVRLLKDCDGQIAGSRFETVVITLEIRGWNGNKDEQMDLYL